MVIKNNSWNSSKRYEEFMGKWSIKVGRKFLSWLKEENSIEGKKWLDVGCGTGALTYEIARNTNPIYVLGVDPSGEYLPKLNLEITKDKVEFKVGSANNLPVRNLEYDFVVSALALNFMDDKINCVKEMLSKLKTNGTIAIYVWDYAGKMEFLRYFWDAAVKINPNSNKYDEGQIFPICSIKGLQKLFLSSGINHVNVKEIDIQTSFSNFDEYWTPFLGGQGPAGNYLNLIHEKERNEIKDRLKEVLPRSENGSINLIARAFAISGKKE